MKLENRDGSKLNEKWFDNEIQFNSGLIAIIGNQGSGKSALTDVVGLCGSSKTSGFSFLRDDKFRDREKKASEFVATLCWADGKITERSLDEDVPHTDVERVTYVPQLFFDTITNETAVDQKSKFYKEIKKVIFSHINESERMDCEDLDQLVNWRTKEINRSLTRLREELSRINKEIFRIEKQISPFAIEEWEKQILEKEKEISTHESNIPQKVEPPVNPSGINEQINNLLQDETALVLELETLRKSLRDNKTRHEIISQKQEAAMNEEHRIGNIVEEWQQDFNENNILLEAEKIISIVIDWKSFEEQKNQFLENIARIEQQTDENIQGSLTERHKEIVHRRKSLQSDLEEGDKAYQQYLANVKAWESQRDSLIGDPSRVRSFEWLKRKKNEAVNELPTQLEGLYNTRQNKVRDIHAHLWKLATIYQDLTKDVRDFIASNELTRKRYRLQFDINMVEQGFANRLFRKIKHQGSFYGIDDSKDLITNLLKVKDFNSADDTVEFVEEIMSRLKKDYRQDPPSPYDVSQMVRVNQKVEDLYDFIYGLDYIDPQYAISLNGMPLEMLSPGERGVLLLVFYLLVDRDDKPLIIDQPEGNLNNQAIVRDLVPVFKEAKNRRQIIIVTHNPNLAVVSDAEQIVHAYIDKQDGNKVYFESGAIENPKFNNLMVDVLEGTWEAFVTRSDTYYVRSN